MARELRVLLVEDSADHAELLLLELRRAGYEPLCHRVETEEAFREALSDRVFDVILADDALPRFSGMAALKHLKALGLDIPFLLVSGKVGEEAAVASMQEGAHDYFLKGSEGRLVSAVEREVREARDRANRRRDDLAKFRSEQRLKAIFKSSPVAIAICDPVDGRMLEANPAMAALTGLREEELLVHGKRCLPFLSDPASLEQLQSELMETGQIRGLEVELVIRTGDRVTALISVDLITLDSLSRLVVMALDVSDRKRAEMRLQETRERYRLLVENSNDLVCEVDLQGQVQYVNPNSRTLLGYRPEDLKGRDFFSLIHPEDRSPEETGFIHRQVVREARIRHRDGSWRWFELSGRQYSAQGDTPRAVIISRDITERRRMDQALQSLVQVTAMAGDTAFFRVLAEQLRLALDADAVWVAISDASYPQGFKPLVLSMGDEVTARPSLEDQVGLFGEPVGSGPVHCAQGACDRFPSSGLLRALKAESLLVHPLVDGVGGRLGLLAAVHCRPFEQSTYTRFMLSVFVARAASELERLRAETDKQHLQNQLHQSQKLEAIGTLAGGVAHDFNNILSAIIAFTDLARTDAGQNRQVLEHLEEVWKGAHRARELVQQILNFSRSAGEGRRPVRIQTILKEALKLLRSTLPSTIELGSSIDESVPALVLDPTQVHQVLMNLCTNGAHALRPGVAGRLEVRLSDYIPDESFCVRHPALVVGRVARLDVEDNGTGIDPRLMGSIFDPFFTTKGPGEGTGLGLAVVHGIVKSSQGVIEVQSQVGVGTTFSLFFPVQAAPEVLDVPVEDLVCKGSGERIWVVDDERAITEACRKSLERAGYVVRCFSDGTSVLQALRETPDGVDLVITDLTMPGMTGVDLASGLLAVRSGLPIILTTGYSGDWSAEGVRALGICELLMKPVLPSGMLAAVARNLRTDRDA